MYALAQTPNSLRPALAALVLRQPGDSWTWLDGWTVVGIELVASALCVARGVFFPRGRAVAFVLGAALTSWTIGDLVLTTQTLGGATAPSPGLADVFYIAFYPLAYVAVVLLLRQTVGTMSRPNWLDGVLRTCETLRIRQTTCREGITHQGGLIFVTGFQISAFLRVSPVVTILAPVTKRNQAT